MSPPPIIFDEQLLRDRKRRAAPGCLDHDFLLKRVADDLLERLSIVRRAFPLAADIGAYHGVLGNRLKGTSGIEQVLFTETSPDLVARCEGLRIVADPQALPFAAHALDLAVSGLSLQLVNDLPGTLLQIRRALKPDGLFLAAVLGGRALFELRDAWLSAEAEIYRAASPRVAPFADVRDLGGLLQRAGFALPVVDSETVEVTYATPLDLMREIKAMGMSNPLAERRRIPVTRTLLLRAAEIYADRYSRPGGRITATFEILTMTAWAPHDSQQKPLRPGSAGARLADALGVTENPLPRGDAK